MNIASGIVNVVPADTTRMNMNRVEEDWSREIERICNFHNEWTGKMFYVTRFYKPEEGHLGLEEENDDVERE